MSCRRGETSGGEEQASDQKDRNAGQAQGKEDGVDVARLGDVCRTACLKSAVWNMTSHTSYGGHSEHQYIELDEVKVPTIDPDAWQLNAERSLLRSSSLLDGLRTLHLESLLGLSITPTRMHVMSKRVLHFVTVQACHK